MFFMKKKKMCDFPVVVKSIETNVGTFNVSCNETIYEVKYDTHVIVDPVLAALFVGLFFSCLCCCVYRCCCYEQSVKYVHHIDVITIRTDAQPQPNPPPSAPQYQTQAH